MRRQNNCCSTGKIDRTIFRSTVFFDRTIDDRTIFRSTVLFDRTIDDRTIFRSTVFFDRTIDDRTIAGRMMDDRIISELAENLQFV